MKNLDISVLLDFYGDMLTEKQREVIGFYYNEDLSLSEIGEFEGITRQGVRDSIKRGEAVLWKWKSGWAWRNAFGKCRTALNGLSSARRISIFITTSLDIPK